MHSSLLVNLYISVVASARKAKREIEHRLGESDKELKPDNVLFSDLEAEEHESR